MGLLVEKRGRIIRELGVGAGEELGVLVKSGEGFFVGRRK